MTDKMREFVDEVKQLCKDFSDQRDRPYMGDVHAALEGLYEQWQAAQSVQSVQEVEALICDDCGAETNDPWHDSKGTNRHYHRCDSCNSIPAAELERLRKDAERGRLLVKCGAWVRYNDGESEPYALLGIRVPYSANLSCTAMRENAIDAAIAGETNHG